MMSLKEKIEVMEAFHAGKAIQCRWVNASPDSYWRDVEEPMWNFHASDYRVKPDPKPKQEKDLAMNYDQMIEVLKAAKDGKPIQLRVKQAAACRTNMPGPWGDASEPCWDFSIFDYRVKPEPRVFYAPEQEDGTPLAFFTEQQDALESAKRYGLKNVIRFTEDASIDVQP